MSLSLGSERRLGGCERVESVYCWLLMPLGGMVGQRESMAGGQAVRTEGGGCLPSFERTPSRRPVEHELSPRCRHRAVGYKAARQLTVCSPWAIKQGTSVTCDQEAPIHSAEARG